MRDSQITAEAQASVEMQFEYLTEILGPLIRVKLILACLELKWKHAEGEPAPVTAPHQTEAFY